MSFGEWGCEFGRLEFLPARRRDAICVSSDHLYKVFAVVNGGFWWFWGNFFGWLVGSPSS